MPCLPSELNSTWGENNAVKSPASVSIEINEDGRGHKKKVLIEWGELGWSVFVVCFDQLGIDDTD